MWSVILRQFGTGRGRRESTIAIPFFPFVKHQNKTLKSQDAGTERGMRSKDITMVPILN